MVKMFYKDQAYLIGGESLSSQKAIEKQRRLYERTLVGATALFGLGFEGERVVQKLYALKQEGHKVSLLVVYDPKPGQFEKEIDPKNLPGKKLRDLFPEAQEIVGIPSRVKFDMRGINLVVDCSTTVSDEGRDNHTDNMLSAMEYGLNNAAYAAERDVYGSVPHATYAVDKPTTTEEDLLPEVSRKMRKRRIRLTTNYVESFTEAKRATIRDIRTRGMKVKSIFTARISAVQEKMMKDNRPILTQFGGAHADKAHDFMHATMLIEASHGEISDFAIDEAIFGIAGFVSPYGKESRIVKKGEFVPLEDIQEAIARLEKSRAADPKNAAYWDNRIRTLRRNLNDAHAEVRWRANGVEVWNVAAHLGTKDAILDYIGQMHPEAVKVSVAKAQSAREGKEISPESVQAYYGANFENIEARVTRIECEDGTVYFERTFAKNGGHFSVRLDPDGTATVLFEGAPEDGMMKWITNALASAMGIEEPLFTMGQIMRDTEIIKMADFVAKRDETWILDLREERHAAFAKFMEEPLAKAGCWN